MPRRRGAAVPQWLLGFRLALGNDGSVGWAWRVPLWLATRQRGGARIEFGLDANKVLGDGETSGGFGIINLGGRSWLE